MSKRSITTYHRPDTLEAAWELVAPGDPEIRILSGGADLTIHAPPEVTTLVDVAPIVERGITVGDGGEIHIGAMATLTDVMEHPDLAALAGGVIPEMMVHVGNPLLRNFSTIGGHVARGKLSDVVPVLIALETGVTSYAGEQRTQSLEDYYEGGAQASPHIVTGLTVPAQPEGSVAAFMRFARTGFDFPLLNVSCRVTPGDGGVTDTRIVFGATPSRAQRALDAERQITTGGLGEESITAAAGAAREEIVTGGGWVASAEYRTHLVGVLAGRVLRTISERLGER